MAGMKNIHLQEMKALKKTPIRAEKWTVPKRAPTERPLLFLENMSPIRVKEMGTVAAAVIPTKRRKIRRVFKEGAIPQAKLKRTNRERKVSLILFLLQRSTK